MQPKIRIDRKDLRFTIRKDRAILMICIGIALVFWLLVKLSQEYVTERPVSLDLRIPDDKALAEAPPTDIQAQIEGTGWDLMFDYFQHPKVELPYDLGEADQLSLNRSRLRNDVLRALSSNDLTVTELNYENLTFRLEPKVTKRIPIRFHQSLSFAAGYQLQDTVRLEPDSIEVTGPASRVQRITQWSTDSLLLDNLKSSQRKRLEVEAPPPELSLSTRAVEAIVEVEQFTEKSFFVPLELKSVPEDDSLRYFPQRVKVTCVVGLSRYEQVGPADFQLVADLEDTPVGKERNRVMIELTVRPEFVKSVQFTPKVAEFFIVERKEEKMENTQ